MNLKRWHALSLRRSLLTVLFPGLLLVVGAELWLTWRTAVDAANAAYDRSLLGAIKSIDANISTASGGLGVELPYRLLQFFELTANGRVFYRVATDDGLVEIGSADMPAPPLPLVVDVPQYSDAMYFGEAVRVGHYMRVLDRPLAGQVQAQNVIIQIAETLQSRRAFTSALVWQALARDLMLVAAATGLLVLAVAWALRPLARLRNEVQARGPQDLRPISAAGIPADVKPLVEAINHHIERNREQAEARRRFVDDASHQLRTPLTTLATQVGFALRETDPQGQRVALHAIKRQLDETVRQTNQMLALARAESVVEAAEAVELGALAQDVTQRWWTEARQAGIDLGLEPSTAAVWVQCQPALLREALNNLLHNAIRYTPRGGQVTVRVMVRRAVQEQLLNDGAALPQRASQPQQWAELTVVDNGPGMPADELPRAGERFFRGRQASLPGTGLGLAIVRSVVERQQGRLLLTPGPEGVGLRAAMVLPLAA